MYNFADHANMFVYPVGHVYESVVHFILQTAEANHW
jgi:hypothetical protein